MNHVRAARNVVRRLAKRAIGRWVWIETYRCLRLPWREAQRAAAAVAAPSDALDFRLLERSELELHRNDREHDFSARFLDELASRDDLCFGAFAAGRLVSYCFFAVRPTAIDSCLRFRFPARWIYAYKAFTQPSWRGKRLQQEVFLRAVPEVGRWLRGLRDPMGFVTLVVSDNTPSQNAFARLGFVAFEPFPVLRIRSRPRLLWSPDERPRPFSIYTEET